MLNIADGQRIKIFEVKDEGNYSVVSFSTWRKDKRDGKYKYSNWSFARFVGKAHEKLENVSKGDKVVLKGAGIQKEEYTNADGERAWPKNPQIVVFNFEPYEDDRGGNSGLDTPPMVEDDGTLPFDD